MVHFIVVIIPSDASLLMSLDATVQSFGAPTRIGIYTRYFLCFLAIIAAEGRDSTYADQGENTTHTHTRARARGLSTYLRFLCFLVEMAQASCSPAVKARRRAMFLHVPASFRRCIGARPGQRLLRVMVVDEAGRRVLVTHRRRASGIAFSFE